MGEQKQFRSEAARKNYEKQEKRREQAARRKEWQAKKAALSGRVSDWVQAHPKQVKIGAAALAVALIAIWLLCKWFVGPGGSIPNFFGHMVGVQDNWLVINTAEKNDKPRYHHLADFNIPEGYEKGDFTVFNDEIQQDFYCKPVAEGGLIGDFFISAAKNLSGEEYLERLLGFSSHKEATEPQKAVIAGKDVNYIYMIFDESDTDGEGMAFSCVCIYMDTKQGSAVSAMINSYTMPEAEVPDEAALLAEAEIILAGLTLTD